MLPEPRRRRRRRPLLPRFEQDGRPPALGQVPARRLWRGQAPNQRPQRPQRAQRGALYRRQRRLQRVEPELAERQLGRRVDLPGLVPAAPAEQPARLG